jgi:hypothetical protein
VLLTSAAALLLTTLGAFAEPAGTLLWVRDFGSWVSSPAISPDGTIYIGTGEGLHALTNAGAAASNLWFYPAGPIYNVAVGLDGSVYATGSNGVYAVDSHGSKQWFYALEKGAGQPAVAWDNSIYFEGSDYVYALASSGALKWRFPVQTVDGYYCSPAIAADGTVYIGETYHRRFYALRPEGSEQWATNLDNGLLAGPAIAEDGTIYLTSTSLSAFRPDGTELWRTGSFTGSPTIGSNGTIYISSYGYLLYLVSQSGQATPTVAQSWRYGGGPVSPAIAADGTVWLCHSNTVWVSSPDGQILPYSRILDDAYSGADHPTVIGPDGTLYSSRQYRLYAIATGTSGPAKSHWPMDAANPQRTGRVERPVLELAQARSDGNFELQLYARVGKQYSVEASTNISLNSWTPLTNFPATSFPVHLVDLTASNASVKFYRAREN